MGKKLTPTSKDTVLLLTNREDITADFLVAEFKRRGADYVRFNTEDFPQRASVFWEIRDKVIDGYFVINHRKVDFREIVSVWYRRPVHPVPDARIQDEGGFHFAVMESRAALEGAWRSLDCFWVSKPESIEKAEYKLLQLRESLRVGLAVSPTVVTNLPEKARKFIKDHSSVVYKTLDNPRIPRGEDFGLVYTTLLKEQDLADIHQVELAPSLFQILIPKRSDIRITVVGEKVFAVEIISQSNPKTKVDWRKTNPGDLKHVPHEIPNILKKQCIDLIRLLDLQFAALDFVLNEEGDYIFLEVNPNGQWAWIQQMAPEIHICEELVSILINGGKSQ